MSEETMEEITDFRILDMIFYAACHWSMKRYGHFLYGSNLRRNDYELAADLFITGMDIRNA